MAPAEKGGKKKGHSEIKLVVTREYTINIHKYIHGVGFKCAPQAFKEVYKFVMKETVTPDVQIDTRINIAVWTKEIRSVLYHIHMQLSKKM